MHDDRLGGADPALDLRDGGVGVAGPPPRPAPALGQVLVHVLGEVAQQRELLMQRGRHLRRRHRAQAAALPKLDIPDTRGNKLALSVTIYHQTIPIHCKMWRYS